MDNIYRDIAQRTKGDVYVGVVGPVRTGKSTLIKKFMEHLVLPNIQSDYDKVRARDELPQSASGRTIMTTEPKFIPDEGVDISLDNAAHTRVKLIDCVGYVVPDAMGHYENGAPRMVNTPWSSSPMPFEQAAELGTRKVITDHSTIGMLVTCDGSIAGIPRESYIAAEERVASELRAVGKPFAVVLNSAHPNDERTIELALELEKKYAAPVALINALDLNAEDIRHILGLILLEFPIKQIAVNLPPWVSALDRDHWLSQQLTEAAMSAAANIAKIGQVRDAFEYLTAGNITGVDVSDLDLGTGNAEVSIAVAPELYYRVLSEMTGFDVNCDADMIPLLRNLATVKSRYDKVAEALSDVEEKGYGIVMPEIADLRLQDPEIVKQSAGYGVRLRAGAPSIHMIKADIETEISPVVGSAQQSEELVRYLLSEFEEDKTKIWSSNIFGKTLYELVTEGIHNKLENMPDEAREKLSETLQRIINEGSGGLICIIL